MQCVGPKLGTNIKTDTMCWFGRKHLYSSPPCFKIQGLVLWALRREDRQKSLCLIQDGEFYHKKKSWVHTLSYLKSFIESAVPPITLFLMILMMPLKRYMVKENYLIALLRNEAGNNFFTSGPCLSIAKIRLLFFSAPRWRCLYLIFSFCNVKTPK